MLQPVEGPSRTGGVCRFLNGAGCGWSQSADVSWAGLMGRDIHRGNQRREIHKTAEVKHANPECCAAQNQPAAGVGLQDLPRRQRQTRRNHTHPDQRADAQICQPVGVNIQIQPQPRRGAKCSVLHQPKQQ